MALIQFKQFEKDYQFEGIMKEYAFLERVRDNTFLPYVTRTCKLIEERLTDAKRTKHDKNGIIFFSYIAYLCNFTSGIMENFDTILMYMNKNVDGKCNVYRFIDEDELKRILRTK